ncbi:MAG: hypothetical protein QOF03_1862 [Alphaproteobacteria bacterium]|nr:hypothetical protein [Alphaproteobacteria bacterium]
MLRSVALIFAMVLLAGTATAQGWREYTYPDLGFSLHFPGDPKIEDATYMTASGISVPARIYSLNQETSAYRMIVADFSRRTNLNDRQVIDLAIKTLAQEAEVKLDIQARVSRVFGRQLSLVNKNGSRSSVALFYYQRRLYQIQGTVLPANPDPSSGEAIRFQQSLRFTNNASRLFNNDVARLLGLDNAFGANVRFEGR